MGNNASTDGHDGRPRAGSVNRRIVKAKAPPNNNNIASQLEIETTDSPEEDTKTRAKNPIPIAIAESPSIARELDQELVQRTKQEFRETAESRHRANREKELQDRRKTQGKIPNNNTVKPNPMSRFLSAFSVEPAHPEHKRAFQLNQEEKAEYQEPSEKKLRASEKVEEEVKRSNEEKVLSKVFTIRNAAAAAAVAAIAIFVGLRLNRNKLQN